MPLCNVIEQVITLGLIQNKGTSITNIIHNQQKIVN